MESLEIYAIFQISGISLKNKKKLTTRIQNTY